MQFIYDSGLGCVGIALIATFIGYALGYSDGRKEGYWNGHNDAVLKHHTK